MTELRRGGAFIAVAPWRGRGVARRQWRGGTRGGSGTAGALREDGEGGGLGLVGWLGLSGRSGPGGLFQPAWPLGPKGRVGWLGLPGHSGRKSNKISFVIKIEFLNMPMLWKFAQGNL
jgi:hypothetical protein